VILVPRYRKVEPCTAVQQRAIERALGQRDPFKREAMLFAFQQGGLGRVKRPVAGGNGNSSGWTWDSVDKTAGITLSESNLRWTGSAAANDYVRGNISISGKVYWEIQCVTSTDGISGIKRAAESISTSNQIIGYRRGGTGQLINTVTGATAIASTGTGYSATDILMFAMDTTAAKLWIGLNGIWANSGNPAAGTGEAASVLGSNTYEPHGWSSNSSSSSARIVSALNYAPPSGFSPL